MSEGDSDSEWTHVSAEYTPIEAPPDRDDPSSEPLATIHSGETLHAVDTSGDFSTNTSRRRLSRADTSPQQPRASPTPTRPTPLPRAYASFPSSANEARLTSPQLIPSVQHDTSTIEMSTANTAGADVPMDHTLPENDGMGLTRRKIQEIQEMTITASEKSRLMHAIMTEQYASSLAEERKAAGIRLPSPGRFNYHERASSLSSHRSQKGAHPISSPATSPSSPTEAIRVSSTDLKPTYWVAPDPPVGDGLSSPPRRNSFDSEGANMDEHILGCLHYKRNVKLQCATCARWYTCRFCHDDVEDHKLVRRETKHMLCMLCGCAQPAAGECRDCGEQAAYYYCDVCKLWDNEMTKSIYHCDDCGICRVGQGLGKDFFHCKTCLACLSISIRNTHRCIERATDCNCPICGEYMFSSPQTVVFMRCGHSIHQTCYKKILKNTYKCPICSRSIINMEISFRNMDRAIEAQPMPEQFRDTKALVYCNDCSAKSSVQYHWLGLRCANCDSYNTMRLQILSDTPPIVSPVAENATPSPLHEASPTLSPESSRGRTASQLWPQRRFATSASALEIPRTPTETVQRNARSISVRRGELAQTALATPHTEPASDDELGFWGGTFPRRQKARPEDVVSVGDTSEEGMEVEEDDESDPEDSADDSAEDSADEDDEDDEDDPMDLMGHR